MTDAVFNSDEVMLYGTRFRLLGGVKRTVVTPFPPKLTLGDYSRGDKIVESEWVLSDFSGGLGMLYPQMPRDQDRYWYGTLESRYRQLTLPPLIVQASALGPVEIMIDYNEQLYVIIASAAYRWNESTQTLDSLSQSFASQVHAAVVFNGELLFQCEEGIYTFDGTDWDEHVFIEGIAEYEPGGVAGIVWDDKYFRLTSDNRLFYHVIPDPLTSIGAGLADEGEWTEAGRLQLPDNYCNQLVAYFDLAGELAIHAITKVGVYGYEFASRKFYPTAMTFPVTSSAGDGACTFRGELCIPAGPTGYKYNGTTISVLSPSKDDGLPPHLRGNIIQFVPGHGFLFAVINAPDAGSDLIEDINIFETGSFIDLYPMNNTESNGAVMATPGSAWHVTFDGDAGTSMGYALVTSVDDTYRLWFSSGNGLYYVDLSAELHNPLQNPTKTFRESGYVETGWVDMGWSEMDKLALSLDVETKQCTATETIAFYAAWDEEEEWELIGTITGNGHHELLIEGDDGRLFKTVRLRIEMARGDNTSLTPVMKSCILTFMRQPNKVWGFEFQTQISQEHEGEHPGDLLERLYEIAETKTAGTFAYRDPQTDEIQRGRVILSGLVGAERAGQEKKGRYTVSMIEIRD